jgi:autotransporter-associated beta strand protein
MRWNGNWTFIGSNGAASDLYLGNGQVFITGATRQVTVQNATTTLAVGGVIDGVGFGLTKAGAGTLELRGINTYSGATTITNGTLVGVVGGSCTNSAVTVASTGALGVKVTNTNNQWTCKSLTVSTGTASKLKFVFTGVPSTTVAPLKITGAVTFTGLPTVEIVAPAVPVGTYPLLVKGDGTALAVPALSSASGGSLAWSGDNTTLNLVVPPSGTMIMVR